MARRRARRQGEEAAASANGQRAAREKRELEFSDAPEVEEIAQEQIPQWHDHLVNVRIKYVFRSIATKSNGKTVLAKARKVGGLTAFLADQDKSLATGDPFFVLEVAADMWKGRTEEEKRAIVDHELCHMWRDEDTGKLSIHPHDLEEFAAVVKRHGLITNDLKHFAKATQLTLVGV